MLKVYKAKNINCQNCANLIKNSLNDQFGDIRVNLKANPKEIEVDIKNDKIENEFKKEIKALGFEIIDE